MASPEHERIFLSPPWCGARERAWAERAFDSNYVAPCGPLVDEFERRLAARCGVESAAAVASGTAALDLAFDIFGIGPGDTVVCSDLTFIASVAPAVRRGARPVFVDSDPATGLVSIPLLADALERERPKCVVAVDLYGQCCGYGSIEALCARTGAILVSDAAEALGAKWKDRPAGSAGAAGILSFNGNKIITTSGGGALLSNDPEIVAKARWLSQQAREKAVWYEHSRLGYNYRMSNVLAGIGIGQLENLDEIMRRKRTVFDFYRRALPGLEPFPCDPRCSPTRWLSVFLFPDSAARNAAAAQCAAANIETRPIWKPMHLQPVFAGAKIYGGAVSEDFFTRGLCLPSGAGLSPDDLERVARAVSGRNR